MKPKVIKIMVLISKIDKKIWDNYVSNFEKFVIIPSKKDFNLKLKKYNNYVLKKIKSFILFKTL